MRNIPKQIHIFVVLVMLVVSASKIAGMVLSKQYPMIRNIPKQIHIFVVLVMLVLAAYRIAGITLANSSPVW